MSNNKPVSDNELSLLKQDMEKKQSRLHAARIAYLNRTPFDDVILEYDHLRQIALEYVKASHTYQKALFGKVHLKLSVAKLLR